MTAQELLKKMKGTQADRQALMQALIQKTMEGEALSETEVVFMEALKKEFIQVRPVSQVVEMTATVAGGATMRAR
jgi:hypothetical protein